MPIVFQPNQFYAEVLEQRAQFLRTNLINIKERRSVPEITYKRAVEILNHLELKKPDYLQTMGLADILMRLATIDSGMMNIYPVNKSTDLSRQLRHLSNILHWTGFSLYHGCNDCHSYGGEMCKRPGLSKDRHPWEICSSYEYVSSGHGTESLQKTRIADRSETPMSTPRLEPPTARTLEINIPIELEIVLGAKEFEARREELRREIIKSDPTIPDSGLKALLRDLMSERGVLVEYHDPPRAKFRTIEHLRICGHLATPEEVRGCYGTITGYIHRALPERDQGMQRKRNI